MIKKKLILLIFIFYFLTYYINNLYEKKTPWALPNLKGYAYLKTGEIDDAGGFGAIDFVIKKFGKNSWRPWFRS